MFIATDYMLCQKAGLNKSIKIEITLNGFTNHSNQKSITERSGKSPGVWILTNKLLNNSGIKKTI